MSARTLLWNPSSRNNSCEMTKPPAPYRLKIERAKRHIQELSDVTGAFLSPNPYHVYADDYPETNERLLKVRVTKDIPPDWSAIVGDAIHNARAALDLLMVAVVKHCDPHRVSYNHVHFVIRETKDKFEADLDKNTKGASSQARSLIEGLKPYKGGDENFWNLHQLDILDKHKSIIPVASSFHAIGFPMVPDEASDEFKAALPPDFVNPVIFWRPARKVFPLQDGTTVFKGKIDPPPSQNIQWQFAISFGEGQILDGEPIIPALRELVKFVEGIFDVFESGLPGLARSF